MFLLPGAIICMYITGTLDEILGDQRKHECIRYLRNHQREDPNNDGSGGGWGIDIERHSTQFGTVLNYVTLRLLGVSPNEAYMKRALRFIHKQGGAVSTPSWGKFWLACLGCFDWRGYNSVLPELWLTPYKYNPIHPGRWWCHCMYRCCIQSVMLKMHHHNNFSTDKFY
jgi:cycloartenol synthase